MTPFEDILVTNRIGKGRRSRGRKCTSKSRKSTESKQPSAKLLSLITNYFHVPVCKEVNVGTTPTPKTCKDLCLDDYEMEEKDNSESDDEKKGNADPNRKELYTKFYGPLPCRRQRQRIWDERGRINDGGGFGTGMPGLGREVLRWLVTLNLSFPIKNIKRDFSNGYMVAEIFSRYFPTDVHMHSFDYGSREASKRDNWDQLVKILKKKNFLIQDHEIQDIIHCRIKEGAGPLLERMHKFLTATRWKPSEGDAEQPFSDQYDACREWNLDPEGPSEAADDQNQQHIYRSSCSISGTSTRSSLGNHGDCDEDFQRSDNHDQSQQTQYDDHNDGLYSEGQIKLDYKSEQSFLLNMDDEEYARLDFTLSSENATKFILREEEERRRQLDVSSSGPPSPSLHQYQYYKGIKNKGISNAVEKARQREVKKELVLAKEGVRGEQLRVSELARKARVEAGLAFRSPNRKRNFKEYTLPDYRRQKQFGYVELGRLGPGDPSPDVMVKRDRLAQRKEFGRRARSCNIMSHVNPTLVDYTRTMSMNPASSRKKALAFASKIPKPKVKVQSKEAQESMLPLQNPHAMSDLQILEAKHQSDKQHIESIRRDLEHFLR